MAIRAEFPAKTRRQAALKLARTGSSVRSEGPFEDTSEQGVVAADASPAHTSSRASLRSNAGLDPVQIVGEALQAEEDFLDNDDWRVVRKPPVFEISSPNHVFLSLCARVF